MVVADRDDPHRRLGRVVVPRARRPRARSPRPCRSPCLPATTSTRSRPSAAGRLRRGRFGVHVVRRAPRRAGDRARLLPVAAQRSRGQRARPAANAADQTFGRSLSPRATRSSRWPTGWQSATAAERGRVRRRATGTCSVQPTGLTSLEGLLFPDTYQVSNADNEAQVVERMVTLMERVATQEDLDTKAAIARPARRTRS